MVRVSIEPRFFLFWAFLLLTLPLNWCAAAFTAAVFHELCHMGAVLLLQGKLRQLRLDVTGAGIDAWLPERKAQVLAVLAGPAGSLVLMALCRVLPRVAICGGIQGIYNLLPVFPLDGGRALRGILEGVRPLKAEIYANRVEAVTLVLLFAAAVYTSWRFSMGFWPLLAVLVILSGWIKRKIPCKRERFAVQ